MIDSSTKKLGRRKPTKGELEQLYVKALVKALLELASNINANNSYHKEVTAIWSDNSCELQVSGESKALLKLIKTYSTETRLEEKTKGCYDEYQKNADQQKREMTLDGYTIERVRNAIYLLRELELLEDKRPRTKAGKLENPRLQKFNLKLKSKKYEEHEENYKLVEDKLKIYCNKKKNNYQDSSQNQDNINRHLTINKEDLTEEKLKLLRRLNCQSQKQDFKSQIGTHRVGFFRIQTQTEIRPWFLWVLEKSIGDFEKAQKIKISIDFRIKASFDYFWEEFKQYIKVKKLEPANVIEALAEFYTTKSVVISIISRDSLSPEILAKLNDFYSQLLDKINSIQNLNRKRCLVVFIMDKFPCSINYSNQESLKPLVLTQITKGEVNNWLDEIKNEKLDNQIGYEVNDDTYTQVEQVGENPDSVIDYICKIVFKSEYGFDDFAPYWQHWK